MGRGNAYAGRGQWDQALRAYSSALEEDSESVEARYRLAICQARIGQKAYRGGGILLGTLLYI